MNTVSFSYNFALLVIYTVFINWIVIYNVIHDSRLNIRIGLIKFSHHVHDDIADYVNLNDYKL